MNMFYVIFVVVIIIFWLVVIDRFILVVSFKDGYFVCSKGYFLLIFKYNFIDIV